MRDIIIYVAWWWEKHLSKRSLIKHTCSWRDKSEKVNGFTVLFFCLPKYFVFNGLWLDVLAFTRHVRLVELIVTNSDKKINLVRLFNVKAKNLRKRHKWSREETYVRNFKLIIRGQMFEVDEITLHKNEVFH